MAPLLVGREQLASGARLRGRKVWSKRNRKKFQMRVGGPGFTLGKHREKKNPKIKLTKLEIFGQRRL